MGSNKLFAPGRVLMILVSLLLWLSAANALALPQEGAPFEDDTPVDTGSPFSPTLKKLPSLDDCRNTITAPAKDSSLYFTGLRTRKDINTAKRYAESKSLAHVSKVYPTGFTDLGGYEGTDDEKRQFQKDFSQAYAEKTSGTAYLMIDDGNEPASDSIFYTIEFKAMQDSGKVDKIIRFPFSSPPDDPKSATKEYWTKPAGAANYATGWCGVHVTHYQIPEGGSTYSIEARLFDNNQNEIGYQPRTDATEPVGVTSALPLVLVITAAKPGSSEDPDGAEIRFAYGDQFWGSGDESRCSFGGYEDGNREGDCGFSC